MNRLAAKPDMELTEFNVAELELPFCKSCHMCFSKGEEYCPHDGILRDIRTAITGCDGVIVSGVTYIWAVNAALKNLLDHFAYWHHRPALFGKKGMVVVTSAGYGESGVAKFVKTIIGQWGINGALIVTQNAKQRDLQSAGKLSAKLDKAAEQFYQLIASKKPLSPKLKNIVVHNAFRAMSLCEFSDSECDTRYWRQEHMNKAYPVKTGPLVYAFGTMVFSVIMQSIKIIGRKEAKRPKIA